jgi:hypothetical protein
VTVLATTSHPLLQHPMLRRLLFERFLVTASATLAFAAIAMGRVTTVQGMRGLLYGVTVGACGSPVGSVPT